MKRKIKNAALIILTMLSLIPFFSSTVYAKTTIKVSGDPRTLIVIPFILGIAVIALKLLDARHKSGKDKKNDFFDGSSFKNELGLTPEENQMLRMFQSEVNAKKPNPVSISCPNCGAPLTISDIAVCPYCRSSLENTNIDPELRSKKHKPIPPEQYNPIRYYEENRTGYENINNPRANKMNTNVRPNNDYHVRTDSGFSPYTQSSGSDNTQGYGSYGDNNTFSGNRSHSGSFDSSTRYNSQRYGGFEGSSNSFGSSPGSSDYGSGFGGSSGSSDYGSGFGGSPGSSDYGSGFGGSSGNSDYGSGFGDNSGSSDYGSGFATGDGFSDNNW